MARLYCRVNMPTGHVFQDFLVENRQLSRP